jgi:hypothetical protein
MNRRDMLRATTAGLLSGLLPTWVIRQPVRVPLEKFCTDDGGGRFSMATPFVQASKDDRLFAYATNAAICVRADASQCNRGDSDSPRPSANRLPWQHDTLSGWKPWPKENYLLASNSDCPACNGYGTASGTFGVECAECEGFGCLVCSGNGAIDPTGPCRACGGKPIGIRPDIQRVGDFFVASKQDRVIRANLRDLEWTRIGPPTPVMVAHIIAFRFDGGLGLLMPLDEKSSQERLTKA